MPTVVKNLAAGTVLTTILTTYYTAGDGTSAVLKKLTLCNATDTGGVTVTCNIVKSGDTADQANTITSQKTIAARKTVTLFDAENHVLEAGDFIQLQASADNTISLMISGVEVT